MPEYATMRKTIALLGWLALLPLAASALELDKRVKFDIPAQQLATALIRFAQQTEVQVVTAGQKVQGVESQGVNGEHSLAEALNRLLEGTGFAYRVVGQGTVTIVAERVADASGVALAPGVEEEGKAA